jgi:hypothetical protein
MGTTPSGSQDSKAPGSPFSRQFPTENARLCAFCGHRDPRWYGKDATGWSTWLELDRCPGCGWEERTVPLYIPGESLAA